MAPRNRPWLLVGLLFVLTACNKSANLVWAPMGGQAPEFGKTPELGTLSGFVVGKWCLSVMGNLDKERYYEFKKDGTFESGHSKGEWKSTGKWSESNGAIQLQYDTMNGKPLQVFQAEYKKDEEGGGQVAVQRALTYDEIYAEIGRLTTLVVDDDRKHLSFDRPSSVPLPSDGADTDSLTDLMKSTGSVLERMGPQKA